jgi:glutathione S-transferase
MSLVLYHAMGSCAFAPLVALEEAGAEFELRMLDLARGDQRDPRYLAINAHGRVPALVADGQAITEATAVLVYLAAAHPERKLLPTEPLALGKALEFLSWVASSVHVALAQVRRPARFLNGEIGRPELAATGRERFGEALSEIDALCLKADPWLSGSNFGAMDMVALVVRRWAEGLALSLETWPNFLALTGKGLDRPAVQRALARERDTAKFFS